MQIKKKKRTNKVWLLISLLFLLIAIPLTIYQVYRTQTVVGKTATRPPCTSHNDCPNNWMYCLGGECWSYDTNPRFGAACQEDRDCGNKIITCNNGRCSRDVGPVGGCSQSQDCVNTYWQSDPGQWSCTNGQCLRLAVSGVKTYIGWDNAVHNYGSWAACSTTDDCGPNATCDEYHCVYKTNRDPCHGDDCGVLPTDTNKKYVCADASGKLVESGTGKTGTCVVRDVCDPQIFVGTPCGPGQHCAAWTSPDLTFRGGACYPDSGTSGTANQPPAGWTTPCPSGTTLVERCSNTADEQRVRYCIDANNTITNIVRWNNWHGSAGQWCTLQGEVWTQVQYTRQAQAARPQSPPPTGFYDSSTCGALGTRIVRCSNTYAGQLVSYCPEDQANPEKSAIRWDNYVGANGETCSLTGMVIPDPTTYSAANSDSPWLASGGGTTTRGGTTNSSAGSGGNANTSGISGILGTLLNLFSGGANSTSRGTEPFTQTSAPTNSNTNTTVIDMVQLILDHFGSSDPAFKSADLNGDGVVDLQDMRELINTYRGK